MVRADRGRESSRCEEGLEDSDPLGNFTSTDISASERLYMETNGG